MGRFQFGLLADTHLSGYTTQLSSAQTSAYSTPGAPLTYDRTFSLTSRTQNGPTLGFSLPLSKSFNLGLGARYMDRETIIATIEGNQSGALKPSANNAANSINHTTGAAFDVGMLIAFRDSLNSKFSIEFQDVGDTEYQAADSSSVNEIEKMNPKAGLSLNPSLGKNFGILISFEAERINDSRVNDRDKFRAGCEMSFGSYSGKNAPFAARVGYGMQTLSGGVTLSLLFAKLDLATYGETIETSSGSISDRRYVAKLTVELIE